MKTKQLYHGTTLDNFKSIIKNGFGGNIHTWNCSDPNSTYFYDQSKFGENSCIQDAIGNAVVAAGIQNYTGDTIIIMELECDADLAEDDQSCPNMDDIAVVIQNKDLNINQIKKLYKVKYNPAFKLFNLLSVYGNRYINNTLTNTEESLMKQLVKTSIDVTDIYDIMNEYEEIENVSDYIATL